jgi:prepilin-type N-terminal cleavage/methylation domain-containing protein
MRRVRNGLTLVEMLVVLLLMSLSAFLVAPALFRPPKAAEPPLAPLLRTARETAVRRAEMVYLQITPGGEWRVQGAASREQGDLARGRLAGFTGPPLTLVFSPIGTCAFDARSARAARALTLDPLICELRPSGQAAPAP